MNYATFIGNLTRDPQAKTVNGANGPTTVTNFDIAINGGDKAETFYVRCAAWGARGEAIAKYMKKGGKIFVAGPVKVTPYLTKDGKPQASLELTVMQHEFVNSAPKTAAAPAPQYDAKVEEPVPVNEDIPF